MGNNETKLSIVVDAQNNTAAAFQGVSTSLAGLTSSMKTIGTVGSVAFAALSAFVYQSVDAAAESERIQAQLGAVLKSTAEAAGVSSQAAIELSKSLESTTSYSDEAVLSVEDLLLTFTSIHKDVFPDATKTVLDMATALGEDTKDAAIQLGKALQDPILGVTALRRVGVDFNDQQQEEIANLVQSGNLLGAQTMILHELATEFGGSATAAAGTFTGQLSQLKNKLDDMQEEIGNAVIPVLLKLVNAVAPVIDKIADWAAEHPKLTEVIVIGTLALTGLMAVLLPLAIALPGLIALFGALSLAMSPIAIIAVAVIAAIAGIAAIFIYVKATGLDTLAAWQAIWLGIKVTAADAVNGVIGVVQNMINFIINGVNVAIRALNSVLAAAQKIPGVGRLIPSIPELSAVTLPTINTDVIAASDLASRGTTSSTPQVAVTGNVLLSQDVAQQIGDMIMGKLKLSTQL
jgi:hypothetical protein